MIEYTNISKKNYDNLFEKESKKPYCIEFPNGCKVWKVNNLYHREDGPALKYSNETFNWFLNGIKYSFEEFIEKTPISDEEKVFLRLKYS